MDMEKELCWEQRAAKAMFFTGGFGMATWAPLVPLLKERLALQEDVLGLLLLGIGIGSLFTMPLAGVAAGRYGCRRVLTITCLAYATILGLLSQVESLFMAIPLVLLLGGAMGAIDVVVNIFGILVEKRAGKRIMSGMHAFWSVGGFVGAGAFSLWLSLGLGHSLSVLIAFWVIMLILMFFRRYLPEEKTEGQGGLFVRPKGAVFIVGLITFIAFLTEGAMMDWSGVLLVEVRGMDMSLTATGFGVFSVATLLMRLIGDRLILRLGTFLMTVGGSLLAAIGVLLLVYGEGLIALYGGFFLIGVGSANVIPVFFSLMGRQKVMPVSQAVPAVTTMGYLGLLAGPACIGFLAVRLGLGGAFLFLAFLVGLQALISAYICRVLLK